MDLGLHQEPCGPLYDLYSTIVLNDILYKNKKILKIASADEVDQINPDGGFVKYGLVKNDYVLVKGSLPGPSKRLVILRQPIRPNNKSEDMPQINYISTKSKQGV